MKVAIIGSNSFLAQYIIAELLKNNVSLVLYGMEPILDQTNIPFIKFAIPDNDLIYDDLLEFDVVVYTAGAGIQADLKESINLIYELNAFIPIKIANFLLSREYKGKFITFGSYFEIGKETSENYYNEIDIAKSLNQVPNHYCISKRLLTTFFVSNFNDLNYYHLILPNIYGKGENLNRLIPYVINSIRNQIDLKLTSGDQLRQYIHSKDVACIVDNIIKMTYNSGIYNITNIEVYSVKNVVQKIYDSLNIEISDSIFGSKKRTDTNMPSLLLDNQKAINTFRIKPQITLEEGIRSYYEEN